MITEFILESDPMLLSHEQFPTDSKKWVLQRLHTDWYDMIQQQMLDQKAESVSVSLIDRVWKTIKYQQKIHETTVFGFSQCEICATNIVLPSKFWMVLLQTVVVAFSNRRI